MIPKEKRQFGVFGEGVKPVRKSLRQRRFFWSTTFFFLALLLPIAWVLWGYLYNNYIENSPPTIELIRPPNGVGLEPVDLRFSVEDKGAGIDEVVVRSDQGGRLVVLDKFTFKAAKKVKKHEFEVSFSGKEKKFRAGELKLSITAFDKSFWSNRFTQDIFLRVDYKNPKIEVISTQHNATQGGVELVFYRVLDGAQNFKGLSGVKMGRWLFPGFPAAALDNDFSKNPNVYFTFFPVPLKFNSNKESIKLFARDSVGNFSTGSLFYRVRKVKTKKRKYAVDANLLESDAGVSALYARYLRLVSKLSPKDKLEAAKNIDEYVSRYLTVNKDYREEIEKFLAQLLSKPRPNRYWLGKFARFPGSVVVSTFGEMQHFDFEGLDAGKVLSGGTGFKVPVDKVIRAANDGIVIFTGHLGVYGQTVIVDHGFGLTSHYSNLGKISTEEGARLLKGDPIGQPGRSGLFSNNILYYEVRMHGVPVRPEEWWDERWLKGHFDKKVRDVKKTLGIPIRVKLK